MAEETNSRWLPDDVIDNWIITKLPVKDLLRYKSVCKRWYSFISSPRFASLHFDHSISRKPAKEVICVHHAYHDRPNTEDHWLRHEFLVGSINGLLAVVVLRDEYGWAVDVGDTRTDDEEDYFDIWIWNPATGMSKKLPLGTLNGVYYCLTSSFGFGWDPIANVYKVIKFVYGMDDSLCEMWSSNSDSWRDIVLCCDRFVPPSFPSSFHPYMPINSSNVTLKGGSVVCWIFKNNIDYEPEVDGEDGDFVVASFDMSSDVLKMIPFPELPVSVNQLTVDLCNLNGVFCINWKENFAMVERYTSGIPGKHTVWVLDVEEECWTKEAFFVLNDFSLGCLDSSNEKLVLMASMRLAVCDMESGKVEFLGSSEIRKDYVGEARLHHASFVSVDGFVPCKEELLI